uniref:Ubiquitin fusion degradation protein UFD1 N-terminal subdomain 2 domain-containing protein n=1 Tax=Chromera velia CCMP2878 TaxID=1169474 RepID=A0A0G4HEN4_9ALVE|mmetsp:Transcript_51260/g.100668  ORF Transcript_51260/g.100668 Transcript_51260/m.100668 type:complete len:355 (+) Transcript_51260:90-1154(+)|eukprot:Cvel_26787.t1-p1 / transcript=Cvel_26787.t1 / gene=Cvel_26787 / organism=Chromera_velia_CCMP2878 / gene_product=Ubiquitin fusion degradation protein 1, putative / transcript_product=Ubiquitin fusion degradation protein 1, putative / location=Cvel_scaffold3242:11294-13823(+) / protein_length=354 / sequence_SO=supercontig / SO=protein_coding / is_pseudo=false
MLQDLSNLCLILAGLWISGPSFVDALGTRGAVSLPPDPIARRLKRSLLATIQPRKRRRSGLFRFVGHFRDALRRAQVEQWVEDTNAALKTSKAGVQFLIAMPISDRFDPAPGTFSHGHVMTGDKMSLPRSVNSFLMQTRADFPWQFAVEPLSPGDAPVEVVEEGRVAEEEGDSEGLKLALQGDGVRRVFGSIVDFRAPENYVFMPTWMFASLKIFPGAVVRVSSQKMREGVTVKLRPRSEAFMKLSDHQAILESELRHYSALSRSSSILFCYNGQEYVMDVEVVEALKTEAEVLEEEDANEDRAMGVGGRLRKNPPLDGICVQDCDVSTEFLPSLEKVLKKRRARKVLTAPQPE